ncbi:MAG TPA: urease accessory protein UreD [Candidatus Limnocylindria bacterium]|nr:urease accessory protein UreD [Candidatus Limnocylindria bacterium]
MSANALQLEAQARDGRTVLSRIRASGLSRSSRPFREGAAARVVVSHLGPGMVRGDAFSVGGRVEAGAHLIVAGQMATRVLSGPQAVTTAAAWDVERGATLELLAEPTIVCAGAALVARTEVTLSEDSRVLVLEIVRRERGAALRSTTTIRTGERLLLADTLQWDADDDEDAAIGTLVALGFDLDFDALDRVADACAGVRTGIGTLRGGGILTRIRGTSVWDTRAALLALRLRCIF